MEAVVHEEPEAFSAAQPFLEPATETVLTDIDVYVAGVDDRVAHNRTLSIHKSSPGRWVGRIDANLQGYTAVRLELRLPAGTAPRVAAVVVGPTVRGETLIWGTGPTPTIV